MSNEEQKQYDYEFKELQPYIIGNYKISDWFEFTIYSNQSPAVGDKILLEGGKIFEVESVSSDTDDDEFEQGLSYSKVWMSLCR